MTKEERLQKAKRVIRPSSRQRKDPRGFLSYPSYNFKDKDPAIWEVWDVVKGVSFNYIEDESGVRSNTLYAWFYGGTKKPQNCTVRAVLRSVGYDYRVTQIANVQSTEAPKPHPVPAKLPARNVSYLKPLRHEKRLPRLRTAK